MSPFWQGFILGAVSTVGVVALGLLLDTLLDGLHRRRVRRWYEDYERRRRRNLGP